MQKKTAALLLCVMIATAAVLAAGCGGGQEAPQPGKSQPIVIAYTPWTGYAALFIAQEKGMFKAKGLDVTLQSIEGVGDRKQAMVAKKIQAMATSLDVSISAAGADLPLKLVWAFDASNGADGLVVAKDKGIATVADLKGRQVAYHTGSASHFFLKAILDRAGLSEKDIQSVDVKASEAASAFMAGKVDAAVTWEPHLSKAVAQNGMILSTTTDTPGLIADVLTVHADFARDSAKETQAIVEALAEASAFMQTHPDEANKILAVLFKQTPEEVASDSKTIKFYDLKGNQEFYGTQEKPGLIYEVAKGAGQFYVDQKVLSQLPEVTKYIDNSFISKVK
ncbi:ABC transporter substrate-binding protein [Acetonema longum]|uniref:ABC transporter n=1 Tax=Acetonema longum DSM 6540 TaxID=1009370 RepID=F7NHW0_9FIRM|nr:ABC transporter substrate-binding protein [Acetonema longum]EGO64373.1 ABC transporter [Acetonema longum DSM 6540]